MEFSQAAVENLVGWQFDNSYSRLPAALFAPAKPSPVREPKLVILNDGLAQELGLDFRKIPQENAAAILAGQILPAGSNPIAQAYAGHQFGGFTMLGDGRAILLGEHRSPGGQLVDIQFKGSGQTAYSRRGDGRAALGPMLREYIISEAMAALGIPTTRSLAVVTTGEAVYRQSVLRGAVLTRVAASHIRVGTFEYLAARRDEPGLRALADYAIARHYPEVVATPDNYLQLFRAVVERQAALIAKWQMVGFIHGVMNTDNMAISGQTIDYGPCAFMNSFHEDTVFSSIDHGGRYAYGNQPAIGHWNLARFAESLLALLHLDPKQAIEIATKALNEYPAIFERHWLEGMRRKLGLEKARADDLDLIQSLLAWMQQARVDWTNTFRDLSNPHLPTSEPYREPNFLAWHARWRARLREERRGADTIAATMQAANPAYIPRNHRVEEAIAAAEESDDYAPFERLLEVVGAPFDQRQEFAAYTEPPADECGYRTFCGT